MKTLFSLVVLLCSLTTGRAAPSTVALVPKWHRVTIAEAKCAIDMPAPRNFHKVERLDQPEGRGIFGVDGTVSTDRSRMGIYLVMYGVTTKFQGSKKDMRRFVQVLSGKVDRLVQKMFADSFTLKKKHPISWKNGEGTDYIYGGGGKDFTVQMRKLIFSDRAYFLIGVGSPADVARFMRSLEPLFPDL